LSRCICALAVVVSAAKVAQWELYRFGDRGGQMVAIDRLQEPASQTGRQLVDCKQLHTLCAGKRCLRPAMAPSVAVRDDNGAAQRSLLIESDFLF
jgi:hypothetical protein